MDYYKIAIQRIKPAVDGYLSGNIKITSGCDDFDITNRKYDVSVIMGIISNHIKECEERTNYEES